MNCPKCGELGHESNENQLYLCVQYVQAQRDRYRKWIEAVLDGRIGSYYLARVLDGTADESLPDNYMKA